MAYIEIGFGGKVERFELPEEKAAKWFQNYINAMGLSHLPQDQQLRAGLYKVGSHIGKTAREHAAAVAAVNAEQQEMNDPIWDSGVNM